MNLDLLSPTAMSNLFTKGCTARRDKRQKVRKSYSIPSIDTRKLLAQLILEEALETVKALGFNVATTRDLTVIQEIGDVALRPTYESKDLEKIIDGCCDTIYVATGALVACGVPDIPHMQAVCGANNRKFPDGQVVFNEQTGKYLKPLGWVPPDHQMIRKAFRLQMDMIAVTRTLMQRGGADDTADERSLRPVSSGESSPGRHGAPRHSSGHEIPEPNDQEDQKADKKAKGKTVRKQSRKKVEKSVGRESESRK